jgi:phosphoribosylaminoimidazolecarboxamide formyltransferase/IMP cyclohydrolase
MLLRYGTNPHQAARTIDTAPAPLRVISGQPSYINLLDALNAWPLVREAARGTGRPAAASFKHVSPAGAAFAGDVDSTVQRAFDVGASPGPLTSAYLRARDADPKSSFGDMIAVSAPVDEELAEAVTAVIADGIVAPGFAPGTVERLATKKRGTFLVLEADPAFDPPEWERREVYGLVLDQERDRVPITAELVRVPGESLPATVVDDAILGMVTTRYTQSNSVVFVRRGVTIGIGAGQQSRVDCTRLCGAKARLWWLRRHPAVERLRFRSTSKRQDRLNWQIRYLEGDLTDDEQELFTAAINGPLPVPIAGDERLTWERQLSDVTMVSDGYIPFRDNVDVAARHGVATLVEPGGSRRSDEVAEACKAFGIRHVQHGLRLFHH